MRRLKAAQVLFYDIENFPNIGYTWGKWEQNVIEFVQEKMICSIAWRWQGEKTIHCRMLPDYPGYDPLKPTAKFLLRDFRKVLNVADVSIAHNGDRFDDKSVNTEFLIHKIREPKPRQTVDTLKIARGRFNLNSNKLDDLCKLLGIGRKLKHQGFELWRRCMAGDSAAWKVMRAYNSHDITLLEGAYMRLRSWDKRPPDLTNFLRVIACPVCQSGRRTSEGWQYAAASKRPRYCCKDCGKWYLGQRQSDKKSPHF